MRAGHLFESSNRPPPTRPRSRQDGWGDDRTRIGVRGTVCYAGLPLLRPFALGYAPFPRTVKGKGAQQRERGVADAVPRPRPAPNP